MSGFMASVRKNRTGILIMLLAAMTSAVGQLFWKIAGIDNLFFLFLGFFCYGMGAVLMIAALRYGSLSVLHPVMSSAYLFALLLGYFYLSEPVSPIKIAGVLVIMLGIALLSGGDAA